MTDLEEFYEGERQKLAEDDKRGAHKCVWLLLQLVGMVCAYLELLLDARRERRR